VRTRGVGIMNSTTFLLLANSNTEGNGNQEMELTIGSLNFCIGSLGSIRLSHPVKPDPSASETIAMFESSVGSSNKVNSSVSFAIAENTEEKIEELDETMENIDLGDQLEDFMICYDDTSNKSTDTWKTGLELHEDNETIFSSSSSKFDNRYQVLAIIGDNSEELDDNNNLVLNLANINRGANYLAEGDTTESLASREKNLTISRGVEHYQSSRGARRAYTNRCREKHAFRVSLCLRKAIKATGKRKKRYTKKERFNHCSKHSSSQSTQQHTIYK
jgi:hypothetical protein